MTIGGILIALGLGAYLFSDSRSFTALIPAILGALYLVAGLLSRKAGWHKHAMHGAAAVALLAFLGTVSGLFQLPALLAGTAARPVAVVVQAITAVLSLVFLVLAVRSFVAARRGRATSR